MAGCHATYTGLAKIISVKGESGRSQGRQRKWADETEWTGRCFADKQNKAGVDRPCEVIVKALSFMRRLREILERVQ